TPDLGLLTSAFASKRLARITPVTRRCRHLAARLTGSPQFLADDSSDCRLQRFASTCDVLKERIVDQRLIVAAAGVVHLLAEPIQNAIVEADGHARFPQGSSDH